MSTEHTTKRAGAAERAQPDLSRYLALHRALRQAHDQLVVGLTDASAEGERRSAALHRWFCGFSGELRHHHQLEDRVFFPALAARVPAYADYSATLDADHLRLEGLIDRLSDALRRLTQQEPSPSERRAEALAAAVELRDLMAAHLDFEDRDILPMFERHFSAEQYAALDAVGPREIKIRQALFTVPWFMATVDPKTATDTLRDAPLPMKLVYRLTRKRYARLVQAAFGTTNGRYLAGGGRP